MSTTPSPINPVPGPIYSLLPAVFRTRDIEAGGQLAAFFSVLETQYGIVRDNLEQLYDDQFIETCAPWAIPYIGELIGYDPVYTVALSSPDTRAEVANTIGYRRRKGTLLAMEQLTHDVSGRTTMVVEEFRRLVTTLSLRDVRLHNYATANLRRGRDWEDPDGPFTRLQRTIDVRRIAPRSLPVETPASSPLNRTLHGGGRFNIPDVAVWMWRWQSWPVTGSPAFDLGGGGYFFSSLGAPMPLFQQPPAQPLPFTRLINEADAPQMVTRLEMAESISQYYPSSFALIEDGVPVDVSRVLCANLDASKGPICCVPSGMIAIDPELGRIQYAGDVPLPNLLEVNYSYGFAGAIAGGPYDRTSAIVAPTVTKSLFYAVVGSADFPALADAVSAWNLLEPGAAGTILLPDYEAWTIDLTAGYAVQIQAGSQLLIASAEIPLDGAAPQFTRSCATLRGDIEILGMPAPQLPDGAAAPMGQLQISGIKLAGELRLSGEAVCIQVNDSTLVPGRGLNFSGDAVLPGEPSVTGSAIGAYLCLTRTISGPIALPANCSVRIIASIVDASAPCCVAYAGPDLASAGATLHIEDSTVIGRVWTQTTRLASNTIFNARLARRDPWKAPVWANRRQTGCVRFCWLPWESLTPRRYECLPPDGDHSSLVPRFVSLRFGDPGYAMLSGDVPLAIWKGAANGSQMGVYLQTQETEAVTNIQIRSQEYLPANLERGVFLIPSAEKADQAPNFEGYGDAMPGGRCHAGAEGFFDDTPIGIGIGLM